MEGNIAKDAIGKTLVNSAESKTWSMGGNFKHAPSLGKRAGDPTSLLEEVADNGPKTPLEVTRT